MGWRWRKSINIGGGFRTNMSRHGIGWSWGIPGFRYGKGADGSSWISIGIPGTGLYFTMRLKRPKSVSPSVQKEEQERSDRKESINWHDIKR